MFEWFRFSDALERITAYIFYESIDSFENLFVRRGPFIVVLKSDYIETDNHDFMLSKGTSTRLI